MVRSSSSCNIAASSMRTLTVNRRVYLGSHIDEVVLYLLASTVASSSVREPSSTLCHMLRPHGSSCHIMFGSQNFIHIHNVRSRAFGGIWKLTVVVVIVLHTPQQLWQQGDAVVAARARQTT